MAKILLVEDDPHVRNALAALLNCDGYTVTGLSRASDVMEKLRANMPDAVLLDIHLPDGNGLDLISPIRACTDAPIIVVSGSNDIQDRIRGFDLGADDFLAKPFQPQEMTARLRAHIRRHRALAPANATAARPSPQQPARIAFAGFILDPLQMQVFDKQRGSVGLTIREYRLLEVLVRAPQQVHPRHRLLDAVRSDNLDISDRAIDVQMLRIRRKLGDVAKPHPDQIIRAVRSVGYMLACPAQPL